MPNGEVRLVAVRTMRMLMMTIVMNKQQNMMTTSKTVLLFAMKVMLK